MELHNNHLCAAVETEFPRNDAFLFKCLGQETDKSSLAIWNYTLSVWAFLYAKLPARFLCQRLVFSYNKLTDAARNLSPPKYSTQFEGKNRNTSHVRFWPLTRLLLMATCDMHPLPHLWCQNVARNVPLTRLWIHLPEPITPGLSWLNAKSSSRTDTDRPGCAMRSMKTESRLLPSDPSACY